MFGYVSTDDVVIVGVGVGIIRGMRIVSRGVEVGVEGGSGVEARVDKVGIGLAECVGVSGEIRLVLDGAEKVIDLGKTGARVCVYNYWDGDVVYDFEVQTWNRG